MGLTCLCWIKLSNHFASLTKPKSELIGATIQPNSEAVLFQRNSPLANGHVNLVGDQLQPEHPNLVPPAQPLDNEVLPNGTLQMEDL